MGDVLGQWRQVQFVMAALLMKQKEDLDRDLKCNESLHILKPMGALYLDLTSGF